MEYLLPKSESYFPNPVHTSPALIWVFDVNHHCSWVNQRWLDYTGRDEVEIVGHCWHTSIHPDDLERTLQSASSAISEHDTFSLEYRLRRSDGSYGWITLSGIPRFTADGALEGYTGYGWDINDAKLLLQQEEDAHFLESLDQVNQAMQGKQDIKQMMRDVLDVVLSIFDCDRAWLLDPCDPQAASWRIPMECTKPEYPGAAVLDVDMPMGPENAEFLMKVASSSEPVTFGVAGDYPVNTILKEQFSIHAMISMQVIPRFGMPWVFGIHHCRSERQWSDGEQRLFQEIGWRLTDGLNTWLAYQDIKKSERRYREVFENSSECIYLVDVVTDGRFKFVDINPAWEKAIGYCSTEIHGKFVDEVFSPELAGEMIANFFRCVVAGAPMVFEECLALPTGQRHFHTTLSPVHDDKGRIYRIVGNARDMTEQIQAEADVSLLTYAMDHVSEAAYLSNESGQLLYINEAACCNLGYHRDDLLEMSVPDIVKDFSSESWQLHQEELARQGELSFETWHRKKDGSAFPVQVNVTHFNHNGSYYILALAHNITERKRMEERLAVSERDFRSLAENLPDNIARWDVDGRILYSNPTHQKTMCEQAGKQVDGLIGKLHAEIFPDGRLNELDTAIASVVAKGESIQIRAPEIRENGEVRTHEVKMVPEFDEAGNVVAVLGIGRDMTDLYRMQEDLATREQEFRSLAESVPNSIIRYDLEHRILYLNSHLVKELGLASADEVIGKRPIEVWPDGRYAVIDEAAKRAIESGNTEIIELVWEPEPEPGQTKVGGIYVVPERDINGDIIGTIAYWYEITEILESERRLAHFINSLPGLAYTFKLALDGTMSFPYISSGVEDIYGIKPEVAIADFDAIHNLAHPDDRQYIERSIAESAQTMSPHHIEIRIRPEENQVRWLEMHAVPESQIDGSTHWYGIMLDITERKHAQQRLELLDRSVNSSLDAIYIMNEQIHFTYVNATACQMLGYEQDEFLAMGPANIDPDVSQKDVRENMQSMPVGEKRFFETRHKSRDGQIIPVEISATYFEEDNKKFMLCVVRDITERKRIESVLLESKERYRNQRNLLSAIFESTSEVIIYALDRDYRYLSFNSKHKENAKRIWNADIEIGMSMFDVMQDDEELVALARQLFDKVLAGDGFTIETSHILKYHGVTGQEYWQNYASPIHADNGTITGFTVVAVNVTERKLAEHLLKEANDFANGVINAIPDVLFEMDRDGTYLNIWTQNQEQLAAQKELLLGKTVCNIFPTEVAEEAMAAIREAEANGIAYGKVIPITQPDGEVRWFEHSLVRKKGGEQSEPRFIVLSRDITERKKMEQQLQASKNFLTNVVDTIADPVFVKDRQHSWVLINEPFCNFVGLAREELLGKSDFHLFSEDEAQVFWDKDEEVFISGEANINEEKITDSDGNERTIITKKTRFIDVNGELYLVGIILDITERKQLEEHLTRREQEFRALAEHSPDTIARYNRHCRRIYANPAFAKSVGVSMEALIGITPTSQFPDSPQAAEYEARIRQVMEDGVEGEFEFTWPAHDRDITNHIRLVPELDSDGNIISVLAIGRDISKIKESEQQLRTLLDNQPDVIVRYDRDSRRLYVNPKYEEVHGISADQILGKPPMELSSRISSLSPEYLTMLDRVFETGKHEQIEMLWHEPDGKEMIFDLRAIPEFDATGNVSTVLTISRDVSEVKRVERMKNEFVSTVSHELRTPLTSINGALGLMTGALNQEVSGQFKQMLDIAYGNSQRLTLLINDLLDMEKLVAGKMQFDMQTHDLMALIKQALEENAAYGEKYQVHYVLTKHIDAIVNIDAMRLQQVLANYLSNAAKFSPTGGQVEIKVFRNDNGVRVEVIDHGSGIPKEFRDRIFQKFSQADSTDTRQKGGTGLGLAISKELIERMQGCVGFESEPGRTCFYFELPISNPVASNTESENSMGGLRLLVVEDNHDIATVLSAMLEHNHYSVDIAHDGKEALDRLAQYSYDAITLDLLLPDRNGVSLVRKIREMPETADLPIIVVSAYTDGGRQAIEEDYPDLIWLDKPTKEEALIAAIESVLTVTNGAIKMTDEEGSTKGEV